MPEATRIRRFLERCYDGPEGVDAWLAELTPLVGEAIAPREGVVISIGTPPSEMRTAWGYGAAERFTAVPGALDEAVPLDLAARAFRPFRVARLSRHLGGSAVDYERWYDSVGRRFAAADALGLMARDGEVVMIVSIPLDADSERSEREPLLHRVRRHLQAGLSSRRAATPRDAVASAEGRLLHEGEHDLTGDARSLLSSAIRVFERERAGFAPDPDAERVWQELSRGGWAVTQTVDTDGKRFILLRRDPSNENARALDGRERAALSSLANGASHKSVAAELGVSMTTASAITSAALAKLGFRRRVDFVRYASQAGQGPTRRPRARKTP